MKRRPYRTVNLVNLVDLVDLSTCIGNLNKPVINVSTVLVNGNVHLSQMCLLSNCLRFNKEN